MICMATGGCWVVTVSMPAYWQGTPNHTAWQNWSVPAYWQGTCSHPAWQNCEYTSLLARHMQPYCLVELWVCQPTGKAHAAILLGRTVSMPAYWQGTCSHTAKCLAELWVCQPTGKAHAAILLGRTVSMLAYWQGTCSHTAWQNCEYASLLARHMQPYC